MEWGFVAARTTAAKSESERPVAQSVERPTAGITVSVAIKPRPRACGSAPWRPTGTLRLARADFHPNGATRAHDAPLPLWGQRGHSPPPASAGDARSVAPRGMRNTQGPNHGKKSSKFNWDCTICHSCRWRRSDSSVLAGNRSSNGGNPSRLRSPPRDERTEAVRDYRGLAIVTRKRSSTRQGSPSTGYPLGSGTSADGELSFRAWVNEHRSIEPQYPSITTSRFNPAATTGEPARYPHASARLSRP